MNWAASVLQFIGFVLLAIALGAIDWRLGSAFVGLSAVGFGYLLELRAPGKEQ